MNWEETIKFIRTQPEFKELVRLAYFEEDLPLNVHNFRKSEEYLETKRLINNFIPFKRGLKLLDIGSGNGISSVAFALDGLIVDTVEPDPSDTIGAGAIRKLKHHYNLPELYVHQGFAEDLKFKEETFDIVYARQCMHHAHHLGDFIKECSRVLKKGGLLVTVRDHVIYNEQDKQLFLQAHPLQKFYGGENAFSCPEYSGAMMNAGLEIKLTLKHYDNVINYFPQTKNDLQIALHNQESFIESLIDKKLGILSKIGIIKKIVRKYLLNKIGNGLDESLIPGRLYTFIAIKK